ncbi:MAG: ATP/GTP-binding protein [Planctomycetota bacterium]
MLLQFTVGNYLSFRDKTTLSMLAAPGGEADGAVLSGPGGRFVLRVAAIYGANASGKSNLISALQFARNRVVGGPPAELAPFKLDAALGQAPSSFEFELELAGAHYSFGFFLDAESVQAEWLARTTDEGEEVPLYGREGQEFRITPELAPDPERQRFLEFLAKGTSSNQLFLHEAGAREGHELSFLVRWFREGLDLVGHGLGTKGLATRIEQDPALATFLGNFLGEAGTGVSGVVVDPAADRSLLGGGSPGGEGILGMLLTVLNADDRRLRLAHAAKDSAPVPFALSEESDGTRRLLKLAPLIHDLQDEAPARLVVIDELDRSLHTLLSSFFVRAFSRAAQGNHSQLIFTTHDTNLLNLELLRPDSIWFVEKDRAGASHLYSLAEFDHAQLEALGPAVERGYLQGRFGAVPFLGDPERLGWTKALQGT